MGDPVPKAPYFEKIKAMALWRFGSGALDWTNFWLKLDGFLLDWTRTKWTTFCRGVPPASNGGEASSLSSVSGVTGQPSWLGVRCRPAEL